MQIDHALMLIVFVALSGVWLERRQYLAFCVAVVTQAPFWIGSLIFFNTGLTPIEVNMVSDLSVCAILVWLSARARWIIWASVAMLCMGIADVYASMFGMLYYFELHVALHALALAIIVGRKHLDRIDRHMRHHSAGVLD